MKKAVLTILIVFIILFGVTSSSCREEVTLPSSAISLCLSTQTDGKITQEITFSLQSEKLKSLDVKDNLIREVKNNFLSALNSLKNEFYLSFLLVYSLTADENFKIGDCIKIVGPYLDEETDLAGFDIIFSSLEAFQYYQTGKRAEDDTLLGKSIPIKFYSHAESESKFPFAGEFTNKMGTKMTVGERYLQIYHTCLNRTLPEELCSKLDTPSFVYDYATPYSNLRTNADLVLQVGQIYHNVWIKNQSNFKDAVIKLSSTVVYSCWWYLSVLVIAILVLGIGLLIIKFKK